MRKDQTQLNIFPKPLPATDLSKLDPKACLAFTTKGAHHEIAKINIECAHLSKQARPARSFLNSVYRRLAALNQQRHTLDLFIFEDKLRKIPRGLSGIGAGPITSREDYVEWLSTLSPQELDSFRAYLGERSKE